MTARLLDEVWAIDSGGAKRAASGFLRSIDRVSGRVIVGNIDGSGPPDGWEATDRLVVPEYNYESVAKSPDNPQGFRRIIRSD